MKRLEALLNQASPDCKKWIRGKIPKHFKRITVDEEKALELAILGASMLGTYFPPKKNEEGEWEGGCKPYFCQALIAGAILSGEYNRITICTPSQYGKSWLMGHVGLIKASRGDKTYIAGADAGDTDIIMNNVVASVLEAHEEVQLRLSGVKKNDLTRLASALNKQKINFVDAGSLETISLGETYAGIKGNRAVGRGGDYIVDEAARCSSESLAELGRADFANVDGTKCQIIYISNPHAPGDFYDRLTEEPLEEGSFVLWMDALTAVEEERFTRKQVLTSEFAKNKSRRTVYLMCELETSGMGMFDEPLVGEGEGDTYFLGIDAAYKGKDNIEVCLGSLGTKLYVNEIMTMNKSNWVDGVTSEEIANDISRIVSRFHVKCVCVDEGWGVWLKEALAMRGIPVKGINFASAPTKERKSYYAAANASNVRAEMHLDLQELIERRRLVFSPQAYEKVNEVLPHVISERKGRKIQIRPKPELKAIIGHSPDAFDAVLLMVHAFVLWAGDAEEYIIE